MYNNNNNPIKIFNFDGYFYEIKTVKDSGPLIEVVFIDIFNEGKYKNEIEKMKEGLYNKD